MTDILETCPVMFVTTNIVQLVLHVDTSLLTMSTQRTRSYNSVRLSMNGTVRIQTRAGIQRVNVRRLTLYLDRSPSGSV